MVSSGSTFGRNCPFSATPGIENYQAQRGSQAEHTHINNKRKADDAFHDLLEMVSDSRSIRNEVADLERQVLKGRKTAFQKELQTLTKEKQADSNAAQIFPEEAGTAGIPAPKSNFGQFYEHQGEESHYLLFMREYRSVDIQYIRDIKKNKFKPENIMKLSTSVRQTQEATKNLKLGINGLKIEAKEEDCITLDVKRIIPLLCSFHV